MSVKVMARQERLELFGKSILSVLAAGVLLTAITFKEEGFETELTTETAGANTPELSLSFSESTGEFALKMQEQIQRMREERRLALIEKWSAMPLAELTPYQELAIITPEIEDAWDPQHICENDWDAAGDPAGGLGITDPNWDFHDGDDFALVAEMATPKEQIAVARRIQEYYGFRNVVPKGLDENGVCHGW